MISLRRILLLDTAAFFFYNRIDNQEITEVMTMGLFSKIIGGSGAGKSALDLLKDAAGAVLSEAGKAAENAKRQTADTAAPQRREAPAPASGDSWGERMPDEPCQYNYPGSYLQYFDAVLREGFPEYDLRQEAGKDDRSPLFVLYRDGGRKLVVELKSERSSAQAIRRRCQEEGVPYLRFYYDHDGWWNTRSYVERRVRAALGQ